MKNYSSPVKHTIAFHFGAYCFGHLSANSLVVSGRIPKGKGWMEHAHVLAQRYLVTHKEQLLNRAEMSPLLREHLVRLFS